MWASPITTEPPADEPVTLEEAKEFSAVEDDASNALIEGFISAAREQLEAVTGTRLVEQTLDLQADSFRDLIRLPIGPVLAVTEIHYEDTAGAEQELAAEAYQLFGAGLEQGIRPVFGGEWPSTACRAGAVRVTVTVGYETLPKPLWLAMLLMVSDMFANRESVAIGTSVSAIEIPTRVENLLANYRIWL